MTEGEFERTKGRAKEAVGDLTDDERLDREGRVDRASGAAKGKIARLIDRLKQPFRRNR